MRLFTWCYVGSTEGKQYLVAAPTRRAVLKHIAKLSSEHFKTRITTQAIREDVGRGNLDIVELNVKLDDRFEEGIVETL